jgi:3-phosphoshikimate 1-carboxyvinyltransferase
LGSQVTETPDGFVIRGGVPVHGNVVESHGDHRLAMALAVAGLVAQDFVTVQGAEILSESFPGFMSVIQALGAIVACEE